MLLEVDNIKCVACTHLTFCEFQISQTKALELQESTGNAKHNFFLYYPSLRKWRLWLELSIVRHGCNGLYRKANFR